MSLDKVFSVFGKPTSLILTFSARRSANIGSDTRFFSGSAINNIQEAGPNRTWELCSSPVS